MVIYRHHRGGLAESMETRREFNSFEDLQRYIVEYMKPYMNLKQSDVVASDEPFYDERTGWKDTRHLCIAGYSDVSDKEGVEKYFGGKCERPQCIGMFATEYENSSPLIEYGDHGCDCCQGDEALYWKDNENNAFVDSKGEMLVTVKGMTMRYRVKCCPNCGRSF